jgi:hypothetical protein
VQVEINELSYAPTIFLRNAEMQALEHLSNAEKDNIIPISLIKPWANSAQLIGGIKRINKAFPDRKYILDIDRYYRRSSDRPAWHQFLSMSVPDHDFANWRAFVGEIENAIPCIQIFGATVGQINSQIGWADQLQKTFAIRIENAFPCDRTAVLSALSAINHSNYVVVLDAGWSRDVLGLEMWVSGWIDAITALHEDTKIVVSASSFPDSFKVYGEYGEEALQERPLFTSLGRRHNAARLIYGDWCSSRPHGNDGGGPGYPRIDVPLPSRWAFFRASEIDGNFQPLALEATRSPIWDNNLNVWGKYFINNTARGDGYVINSAQQAAAARINIHLNQQISQGLQAPIGDVPEDYAD